MSEIKSKNPEINPEITKWNFSVENQGKTIYQNQIVAGEGRKKDLVLDIALRDFLDHVKHNQELAEQRVDNNKTFGDLASLYQKQNQKLEDIKQELLYLEDKLKKSKTDQEKYNKKSLAIPVSPKRIQKQIEQAQAKSALVKKNLQELENQLFDLIQLESIKEPRYKD